MRKLPKKETAGRVAGATILATVLLCVTVFSGLAVGNVAAQDAGALTVELSDVEDLTEVTVDGNYVLVDDIDASGLDDFEPIGDGEEGFVGNFDGDGNTVTGLTIERSETEYVGMFGYVGSGGTVENVGLEDAEVRGGDNTGGLVGRNGGEVRRSHVTETVVGGDNTGGLVGRNVGEITESYATADVEGGDRVGGLVGRNVGDVTKSYASGSAEGSSDVGGAVGSNAGEVSDVYATTEVEGDMTVGGLVASNIGGEILENLLGGQREHRP